MSQILPLKIAVIDCGTNTFALNIYQPTEQGAFKRVYKERYFVELLEEGKGHIGEVPFQRALAAHTNFAQTLLSHDIYQLRALGTAALRLADNGIDLIQAVYQKAGIKIEVIDGLKEADLIYKGVKMAVADVKDNFLIMDIGGGSVEFIFCNNREVFWAQSFNIGAAVLYEMFQPENPVTQNTIDIMRKELELMLAPVWQAAQNFPVKTLVGASGTFDVIANIHNPNRKRHEKLFDSLDTEFFNNEVYNMLLDTTYQERLDMHHLPPTRAKLIIGVVVLIKLVIDKLNMTTLGISDYALREGTAWEIYQEYLRQNKDSL